MTGSTRILLVDDHTLVRSALAELLARETSFTIVGSVADAGAAIRKSRTCNPDVILMDIDMPGLDCFDAARRIAAIRPDCRIIFLSAFAHEVYIDQALRVKARGYLTKRDSMDKAVTAIQEVMSGGVCFSPEVQARIEVGLSGATLPTGAKTRGSMLTSREIEVLRYIARGLSKIEIARAMAISAKTVDRHCSNLMRKLNIHNRVDLARYAIRENLAEP